MFTYELSIRKLTHNMYCLIYTREFISNENLKDYAYWVKNMYMSIEKIKINDIKNTKGRNSKRTNK